MGGKAPPPWPPPPSRSHLEGPAPFPLLPINRGVREGCSTTSKAQPLPSPTPLLLRNSLAKPCRRTATPSPPHRRAAAGAFFLNLSLLLAESRRGRRHWSAHVLNAEVPLFGAKIGIHRDLNRFKYDSFIRVLATLPHHDLQRYEDALPSRC